MCLMEKKKKKKERQVQLTLNLIFKFFKIQKCSSSPMLPKVQDL